jgi:spermidine synthase
VTRTRTALILAIFVLSGAAGLVYEVVWSRQLVLVFGNTTQAVSAILTGFFGGMAIGSAVGGRLADRVRSPLRMYGVLELILVFVVLATPVTFRLLHEVYRGIYPSIEGTPALVLLRFALALLALGPATILMGATLPTLTRYLTRDGHLSKAFGRLYAANTLGAIAGTVIAGLFLIEVLGLTGALVVGAACSGIAGLTAIALARRIDRDESVPIDAPAVPHPKARSWPVLALGVAFVSGLTSLGYQVLWTRLLASGSGNTTYVFTMILAIFLTGIVIGALIFNALQRYTRAPLPWLIAAQLAVAVLVFWGLATVISDPIQLDPFRPLSTIGRLWRNVVVVVLPVTIVMGIAFPASSALLPDDVRTAGSASGSLLAANTTGAIVGSFIVPFVLIPTLGSPRSVVVIAVINVAMALALILVYRGRQTGTASPRRLVPLGMAATAVAIGGVLVAGWLTPSIVRQPNESLVEARGGRIFASAEDEIASTQAGQISSTPELWVTGTSMTLLTVDAKLMPVLPLIARPDAKKALVVAFGMGSAYRASLIAGFDTEAVELVPSVPKMFHWYYPDADTFLNDPNGRVIVADGRNHLELSQERYDVIVTDPPPPIQSSGASVISSLEYYHAGRDHLTPDGIMMQWMPWGTTVDEFKAHARTFASVFPEVQLVFGAGGYGSYMLGSMQPITFPEASVREVLARPGILDDISSAYDAPAETVDDWVDVIQRQTWLGDAQLRAFVGDGPLVTDDHPLPEYFLLRTWGKDDEPHANPGYLRQLAGG